MSWGNWGAGGGTAMRRRTPFQVGNNVRRFFGADTGPVQGTGSGYPTGAIGEQTVPASQVPNRNMNPPAGTTGAPGRLDQGTGWLDQPGLTFDASGMRVWDPGAGAYVSVTMPPGTGGSPRDFYNLYHSSPEHYRPALLMNLSSAEQARNDDLEALGRGRNWLSGQMRSVNQAGDSWANDPYRQQVMQGLSERADPGYEFFSPGQRTAATIPIGQQYALADIYQRGGQAGRGTSQGGDALQSNAALGIQAGTGGMQVRAQIDAAEQALKQQALSALAGTTAQYNAADTAYMNAGNQLAGALASLESGADFEPTDYTVWPALNDATMRAQAEASFREDSLRRAEEEEQYGFQDLSQTILSSIGSGIPEGIMGFLT